MVTESLCTDPLVASGEVETGVASPVAGISLGRSEDALNHLSLGYRGSRRPSFLELVRKPYYIPRGRTQGPHERPTSSCAGGGERAIGSALPLLPASSAGRGGR